jgi:hypothetical protein
VGELIVTRDEPDTWGQAHKVRAIVHRNGDVELHVEYHCGEQHLNG